MAWAGDDQKEYERLKAAFKRGDLAIASAAPHYVWDQAQAYALAELREALQYLADPNNWSGDPKQYGAALHGDLTPYELALQALGKEPPEEEQPPVRARHW